MLQKGYIPLENIFSKDGATTSDIAELSHFYLKRIDILDYNLILKTYHMIGWTNTLTRGPEKSMV